jgi:hypothetical protein
MGKLFAVLGGCLLLVVLIGTVVGLSLYLMFDYFGGKAPSHETIAAFLESNPAVVAAFGEVETVEPGWRVNIQGHGSGWHGSRLYSVTGDRGNGDVMVYWERPRDTETHRVVRIERKTPDGWTVLWDRAGDEPGEGPLLEAAIQARARG